MPGTAPLRDAGVVHAGETLQRGSIDSSRRDWPVCRVKGQSCRTDLAPEGTVAKQSCLPLCCQRWPGPLQTRKPPTPFTSLIFVPHQSCVYIKFPSCKVLVPSAVTGVSDNQSSPGVVKGSPDITGTTALLSRLGAVTASLAGKRYLD